MDKQVRFEQLNHPNVVEIQVSEITNREQLLEAIGIVEGQVALCVCRNGVYRSAISGQSLRLGGAIVPKFGGQQGLSYKGLHRLIAMGKVILNPEEVEDESITPEVIVINVDPNNAAELAELKPLIPVIREAVESSGLKVAILVGQEEQHIYY